MQDLDVNTVLLFEGCDHPSLGKRIEKTIHLPARQIVTGWLREQLSCEKRKTNSTITANVFALRNDI